MMQGLAFQQRKGSAFYNLFQQLDESDNLSGIVDVGIPRWLRRALRLKNGALDRVRWNAKDQLDPVRFNLMSRRAVRGLECFEGDFNALLQIGSNLDLNSFHQPRAIPAFSFHDNNVYAYVRSLPKGLLPAERIQRAIDFEKRVYDGLSGIFTMSRTLARSFVEDFGLSEDKVHYAGFGSPFAAKSLEGKDYDQQRILFVASHSFERKGGVVLLEAFRQVKKQFPRARLVMVGKEWNIDENGVEVHGFLNKGDPDDLEKYRELFKNASLFVMPSYTEAFGEVFIEAMSHGVPCIGANSGVMPEIVRDNHAGTVVGAGNHTELAETILSYLSNPTALREMGEAGQRAVENEYNWQNVTGRINGVIERYI